MRFLLIYPSLCTSTLIIALIIALIITPASADTSKNGNETETIRESDAESTIAIESVQRSGKVGARPPQQPPQ